MKKTHRETRSWPVCRPCILGGKTPWSWRRATWQSVSQWATRWSAVGLVGRRGGCGPLHAARDWHFDPQSRSDPATAQPPLIDAFPAPANTLFPHFLYTTPIPKKQLNFGDWKSSILIRFQFVDPQILLYFFKLDKFKSKHEQNILAFRKN